MKRTPSFGRRGKTSQQSGELIRLAEGLAKSGSALEDRFWQTQLTSACEKILASGKEDALTATMDQLHRSTSAAYESFADVIEACTESAVLPTETGEYDALLFAAPVLAWSRFNVFSGVMPQDVIGNLRVQLQAHVLAAGAQLALADVLFSPDQLPYGYTGTHALAESLWSAALLGQDLHIDTRQLPQTAPFISDLRYVVGAIVVPRGQALFRWQETDGSHEEAARQWAAQGGAILQRMLPGCAIEPLLPGAYFSTCRQGDIAARPFSVRAAVAFLHTTLEVLPAALRAAVAPFRDERLEEYRIGYCLPDSSEVCHGVVWPLLGAEDENTDAVGEIEAILKEAGVNDVTVLEHSYPREYCDDCGAALFPNPDGEVLHTEMPEQETSTPQHLH